MVIVVPAHDGADGFCGVEDLGAAAFLLFLAAFGDVAHGAASLQSVFDTVSITELTPIPSERGGAEA